MSGKFLDEEPGQAGQPAAPVQGPQWWPGQGPGTPSPKGFLGPGILSHALSAGSNLLTGGRGSTPQEAYNQTTPQLEFLAHLATGLLNPGGFLGRMGASTLMPALQETMKGGSPSSILGQGALGAVAQAIPEAGFGILKGATLSSRARGAMKGFEGKVAAQEAEYQTAKKTYEAKVAHDTEMQKAVKTLQDAGFKKEAASVASQNKEALAQAKRDFIQAERAKVRAHEEATQAQQTQYEQAKGVHSEQAAARIMDDLKMKNPALESMPSTNKGLESSLYGEGKDMVSARFDGAMREAAEKAKGTSIQMSSEHASDLGMKTGGGDLKGTPPGNVGSVTTPGASDLEKVFVDAGDLIKAMTGKSKAAPEAYHAAAEALTKAGIGTDAARSEYKAWRGYTDFVDKNGLLKSGALDTEKALEALRKEKSVDYLRSRELGHVDEGAIQGVRGTPSEPSPLAPPEKGVFTPPEPKPAPELPQSPLALRGTPPQEPSPLTPPDVQYWRPSETAAAGAALGTVLGHPYPLARMGGAFRDIPKGAPSSPTMDAIRESLTPQGALIRALIQAISGQNQTPDLTMTNTYEPAKD